MGLGNDIKKVHMDVMGLKPGQDPVIEAQLTKLSIGIAEAVTKWMMKQEFNITEMKAVVQLEELTTTGNLLADVLSTVQSTIPYSSVMLPSGVPNPIPIPVTVNQLTGRKGVSIPALSLSLTGGQGGVMDATGHAYVGVNPVDPAQTNINNTTVKLLQPKEII